MNIAKKFVHVVFMILGLILTLMIFIFPLPGVQEYQMSAPSSLDEGNGTVIIEQEHIDLVEEKFTMKVENAFCVFGETNKTHYIIEEVKYIEDPVRQTKDSMFHTCKSEIVEESPKLFLDRRYKLIGDVHTHPYNDSWRTPKLSRRDIWSLGLMSPLIRLRGVAHAEKIAFYNHENLDDNLNVQVK